MDDMTLTLQNAQRFSTLLSNPLLHLRNISFNIYASYDEQKWKPSCIIDGKNKCTKRLVNLIYHFKQLVSLYITFFDWSISETPCFPHLIRQQLHLYPPLVGLIDYDVLPISFKSSFDTIFIMLEDFVLYVYR